LLSKILSQPLQIPPWRFTNSTEWFGPADPSDIVIMDVEV
jgi:hypothetical protein